MIDAIQAVLDALSPAQMAELLAQGAAEMERMRAMRLRK